MAPSTRSVNESKNRRSRGILIGCILNGNHAQDGNPRLTPNLTERPNFRKRQDDAIAGPDVQWGRSRSEEGDPCWDPNDASRCRAAGAWGNYGDGARFPATAGLGGLD